MNFFPINGGPVNGAARAPGTPRVRPAEATASRAAATPEPSAADVSRAAGNPEPGAARVE